MAESNFLFQNSIANSAFLSCFLAQIIKVFLSLRGGKVNLSRFTSTGGMPSSHASTMLALATSTCIVCGHNSPEFAIALTLACIIMYDATGIRRAAGEQAKIINYMMENWAETTPKMFKKELKELLGHTPIEVIAGAILGIVSGIVFVKI